MGNARSTESRGPAPAERAEVEPALTEENVDALSSQDSRSTASLDDGFRPDDVSVEDKAEYDKLERENDGVQQWPDGRRYAGQVRGGVVDGEGVMMWPGGHVYTGQFAAGQKHGEGRFQSADGRRYDGQWKNGVLHGTGRYFHRESFTGEFKDGVRHGEGVLTWPDGRRYAGHFENGEFHGDASMSWPDGRRYLGKYLNNHKHGEGLFLWPDGRIFEGQWRQGKRHGMGLYVDSEGGETLGIWQEDKMVAIRGTREVAQLGLAGQAPENLPPTGSVLLPWSMFRPDTRELQELAEASDLHGDSNPAAADTEKEERHRRREESRARRRARASKSEEHNKRRSEREERRRSRRERHGRGSRESHHDGDRDRDSHRENRDSNRDSHRDGHPHGRHRGGRTEPEGRTAEEIYKDAEDAGLSLVTRAQTLREATRRARMIAMEHENEAIRDVARDGTVSLDIPSGNEKTSPRATRAALVDFNTEDEGESSRRPGFLDGQHLGIQSDSADLHAAAGQWRSARDRRPHLFAEQQVKTVK
mmetsp:Transcript_42856/g.93359  ORF Transcript_42856/g.93359 Transcript_42856/m.93359 type:complete len:532 (+) Transcript_42856:101-1696(+)